MDTRTQSTSKTFPAQVESCCGSVVPTTSRERTERAARRFKALADPTRLTILGTLARGDEAVCACDLGDDVDLEQPTVAHHLKVLREAGLVLTERRGKWAYYSLHPAMAGWVRATLSAV
jgi:DNA-binding transcriptional ArsR family regulator